MARTTPQVHGDALIVPGTAPITVGSPAWFAWLEQATTFAFAAPSGRFTARKEPRARGGAYWKAYRTLHGKLHRVYLGRSGDLTLERLHAGAASLAAMLSTDSKGQPPVSGPVTPGAAQADRSILPGDPVHLLATKLFIPRLRPDFVARPRLSARLDAGLDGRLTLVSAPAGSGKTTVISEWVHHSLAGRRAVAWLSLDTGDQDPLQFLRYLVVALQSGMAPRDVARPGTQATVIAGSILALLQSPQPPPLATLLALLVNELHLESTLLPPMVLVLDDYHLVQSTAIHEAMAYVLEHLPPQLHVVIVTREDPPLPLASLRAQRWLSVLRAADLRFTLEEAATFLRDVMGLDLPTTDIAVLEARTEGWIAALQLAALSMQGRENLYGFITAFTGSHRHIVDYLLAEVLQRQPEPVQAFLVETSILDRLCAPLCDAVRGSEGQRNTGGAQAILEHLENANLFAIPLDDERRWYRYHHLFADFLRARLQQTLPEQVAVLHRRAATWLAQHGLVADAVRHALAGEDFDQAADLVEQHAETLWLRGEVATVEGWIAALPPTIVRTRARLCLVHAWMLFLTGRLDAVEPRLDDAERALGDAVLRIDHAPATASTPRDGQDELHGMLATIRAGLASLRGDAPRAIELAGEALARLPEASGHWRSQSCISLGIALDVAGDVPAAIHAFEDAANISQRAGNTFQAIIALWSMAARQVMQGRLRRAEATYHRALQLAAGQGQLRLPAVALAHIGLSDLLRERNDLAAAEQHVREGLDLVKQGGNFGTLLGAYMSLARVLQARDEADAASEALRPAEELVTNARSMPLYVAWVEATRVRLWLAQGDIDQAADWARENRLGAEQEQVTLGTHVRNLALLTLARVYLAQRDLGRDSLLPLLERLLHRAESEGRTGVVIETLALQALALAQCRDSARAISTLERALALAEPEGYVRVFVDEGPPMATLLQQAAQRSTGSSYAQRLLSAFPLPPGSGSRTTWGEHPPSAEHPLHNTVPAPSSSALVEPLTAREIEVLRLLATGASNHEIGDHLVISAGTVKAHLHRIYGKLDVHNRTEAAAWARVFGLL